MVTTRGKQSASRRDTPKSREAQLSGGPRTPAQETSHDDGEGTRSGSGGETVGSRLRKRRRTESTIIDDHISFSKRRSRRKESLVDTQETPIGGAPLEDPLPPSPQYQDAPIDPQLMDGGTPLSSVGGLSIQQSSKELGQNGVTGSSGSRAQALLTEANPDLATVISNIITHGETIDNHYAAHGLNELGIVDTESFLPLGASMHLKIQSLPILDNLAIQLLNTLAKSTFQEVLAITTDPDSEARQAYNTLKSLFDHTKKVYSIHEPFLLPYELGLSDSAHVDIIRKANLATFVSSVFGSQDVGFYHLNEFFLDTFVGDGNRLLKSQAQLFLELKTQAFISAQSYGQRQREELLEDLFPADLEERLLQRRAGPAPVARQLVPSEADFLQRARNRSKALLEEASSDQCMALLTQKYVWEDFLRDISAYVSRNFESLVGVPMHKNNGSGRAPKFYQPKGHEGPFDGIDQRGQDADPAEDPHSLKPNGNDPRPVVAAENGLTTQATLAANGARQGFGYRQGISVPPLVEDRSRQQNGSHGSTQPDQMSNGMQNGSAQHTPPQGMQYHFEHRPPQPPPHVFLNQGHFPPGHNLQPQFIQTPIDMNIQQQFYGDQPAIPFPTQSAPTQVLYERARQAATAKVSPNNRRAGTPSQRRPWSTEEENALMAGLDRVKGPHWSQILAMFGPGGTINEILKDRNQVQLKDKARNLKLFFLKSGIEVPYYLQCVTGELKTRAPAQAAKHEAKEKEKDIEERAHVEGVMTLAGVHEAAHGGAENHDAEMEDAEGESTGDNDLNPDSIAAKAELFNGQQQGYQQQYLPETSIFPAYNNEVTPAFQAMIDAAAAEAARVGASTD